MAQASNKLIILKGLEGNPPTSLSELQQLLAPYLNVIEIAYWTIWAFILLYLFVRYILMPIFSKSKKTIYY